MRERGAKGEENNKLWRGLLRGKKNKKTATPYRLRDEGDESAGGTGNGGDWAVLRRRMISKRRNSIVIYQRDGHIPHPTAKGQGL